MCESLDLETRVMNPLSENSDDSLMTHEPRVFFLIKMTLKMIGVFLSVQEKACLLTRDSSHDSDSSIHYLEVGKYRRQTGPSCRS